MARCNNGELLNKISMNKLTETTEVEFRIRKDLPDCRKINTRNFIAISGTYSYNQYRRPTNRFECMRKGCINTGLLMLNAANETVDYRAMYDATDFAAGIITLYVYPGAGITFPATLTMKISDDSTFTNADVYTVSIAAADVTDDGFAPVIIDLSQTPASTAGDGWTATAAGAYLRFSADKVVGLSSIAIFDSIEDFEIADVVKVACLTTIGGTYDVEMIEAACQESQYNDQVTSLSFPVTGTKVTPNYWKLNPMMAKGSNVTGFETTTVKKTIGADGVVTLADVNQDVCGFIAVQLADACDVTDAFLTQLSMPITLTALDEGHYQVIKKNDGTTEIHFNTVHAGLEVLISYPRTVQIEELVANPDNLNGVHVSMIVPRYQSDGVKYIDIYENVFVTSFPATITTDTAEFAFTITIARDSDGNFFRTQRIIG